MLPSLCGQVQAGAPLCATQARRIERRRGARLAEIEKRPLPAGPDTLHSTRCASSNFSVLAIAPFRHLFHTLEHKSPPYSKKSLQVEGRLDKHS